MLRDYQIEICESVREAFKNHRSVMMQMPTGTGKTVVLASLVQQYLDKGLELRDQHCQVLIVAHRIELTEQMGEHLKRYGIEYGVIAGGRKTKEAEPVIVASIQTLNSKLSSLSSLLSPSLIIIDEAHHAVAKTYRQLWDVWPEARFLGLTATPYRLSGEGFTDLFDVLVDSWSMKRFIAEGWLSAFDYYSIRPDSDDQKLIDNLKKRGADGDFQMKELHDTFDVTPCIERLFESFEQFAFDMKGIVYAIDIAHAEHIAEYYREQGVNALALSSKTDMKERKEAVEAFRASSVIVHHKLLKDEPIQVLVSVDLFSEGFDCPDVEFIQIARPTLSLAKYLQMIGRGLRPNKGKEYCTIIDNVGMYRRFGLPSGERDWGMFFEGLKDERIKELKNLNFNLNFDLNFDLNITRGEGNAALVKIVGYEGMASRFDKLGKTGFERKKKGKIWVWRDTLTGITFEKHPVVVDFKGVEMMTDDGLTFYPHIRSKWVDRKSGINRKALETHVGDGFGWMKRYVSLREPDKVYELQEVMAGGMRVYKDETGKTFFQQDLDSPLVSKEEAGGKKAFMVLCDARKEEWKAKVWESRRNCFVHVDATTGAWCLDGGQAEKDGEFYRIVDRECWFDGNTGFVYHHRPVVRYRGFVKLVYDDDMVYIMNILEERFIAYHNWEIRADDGICTIGNKLYFKSDKDGKALWIRKRSGDFQMFVVDEPIMVEDSCKRPLIVDAQVMIINKYGKDIEMKRIKGEEG
ncbi:MAG: DEAD/DEAH box helicase [Bacteroidales bacterium]|nr:DEAD/DEAH box helicase [Bacteroidales bacterium]